MSANDCTFCEIVGRGIESGIVHNKVGGIAFKYINGKGSVQQRLWPRQGGFHLHAYVMANIARA